MAEADIDDLIEIIEKESNIQDIPTTIPMMPVRDVVVFTDMLLPLFVGREKSIKAVEESFEYDRYIFLTAQKDSEIEKPTIDDVYTVGTVGRVQKMIKLPDGRIKALLRQKHWNISKKDLFSKFGLNFWKTPTPKRLPSKMKP